MSVDIERTVIYDQTVPSIPEIDILETRVVLTAGDDGFLTIEEHQYLSAKKREAVTVRIGLTPPMIAAIIEWKSSEKITTTCPYCGKEVISTWIKNGGMLRDPNNVLVADWIFHTVCWDKMVEENPP